MIASRHSRVSSSAAEWAVRRLTGLTFPESRHDLLWRGLANGMSRTGASDLTTYLDLLEADDTVLEGLVAEITVGETYFFRDPQQLRMIRDTILVPRLRADGAHRPLRIWSAGCASGEEPYSLAVMLHEMGLSGRAEIVGTDIARDALVRARRAPYRRWALRATPPGTVSRYFRSSGDRFDLAPEIRRSVEFRYLNLATDAYPSLAAGIWGMDLILCRNVLIYFDSDTTRRVARGLFKCLRPDGWLVTGASDPLLGDLVPCEVVTTSAGLAYRRAGQRPATTRPAPAAADVSIPVVRENPARPASTVSDSAMPDQADRALAFGGASTPAAPGRETAVAPTLEAAVEAYQAQDYARAAAIARRITGRAGAGPAEWVVLVRALSNAGEMEAAGRACASGLDLHRTCAELAYLHGVLLAEGGKPAEADVALRRALYLNREMPVAHLALAGVLDRTGQRERAQRALRNALSVLSRWAEHEVVPASDGVSAGRLARAARAHLRLLDGDVV